MFTSSNLELFPATGSPGEVVIVRWRLGTDTQISSNNKNNSSMNQLESSSSTGKPTISLQGYCPSIDDEIRMTTSSGELLSRISLDFFDNEQVQLREEYELTREKILDKEQKKQAEVAAQELKRQQEILNRRYSTTSMGFDNNNSNTRSRVAGRTSTRGATISTTSLNHLDLGVTSFRQVASAGSDVCHTPGTTLTSSTSPSSAVRKKLYNALSRNNSTTATTTPVSPYPNTTTCTSSQSNFDLNANMSMTSNFSDFTGSTPQQQHQQQHAPNSPAALLRGERCLRCPPLSGGFIVSLYRCTGEFQRILSVPYRVEVRDEEDDKDKDKDEVTTYNNQDDRKENNARNSNNPNNQGSSNSNNHEVIEIQPVRHITTSVRRPLQTVTARFKWSDVVKSHQQQTDDDDGTKKNKKIKSATRNLFNNNNNNNNEKSSSHTSILGVTLEEAKICSVFVICNAESPDNSGFSTEGTFLDNNNFSHCSRVVRLYQECDSFFASSSSKQDDTNNNQKEISFETDLVERHFVGPELPGKYQCRLMVRAATNIFHTAATSAPFQVLPPGAPEPLPDTFNNKNKNNSSEKDVQGKNAKNDDVDKKLFENVEQNSEEEERLLEQKLAKMKTKNTAESQQQQAEKEKEQEEESKRRVAELEAELEKGNDNKNENNNGDDLSYTESFLAQQDYFAKAQKEFEEQQQQQRQLDGNTPMKWVSTSELAARYREHGTFHDIDEIIRTNTKPVSGISPVAEAARMQRLQRFGRTTFLGDNSATKKNVKSNNNNLIFQATPESLITNNSSLASLTQIGKPSSPSSPSPSAGYLSKMISNASFTKQDAQNFLMNHFANNNNTNNDGNPHSNNASLAMAAAAVFGFGGSSDFSSRNASFTPTSNISFGGTIYQNTQAMQQSVLAAAMAEPCIYSTTSTSSDGVSKNFLFLRASRYRVLAGQYIRIQYDVRAASYGNTLPPPADVDRRHLPSSLDHIRFTPYGRSEKDKFSGSCSLTISGHSSHAGVICVKTPIVSGCFDLGFRRFTDNETLVLAKQPVITDWPDAEIFVSDPVIVGSSNATFASTASPASSSSFSPAASFSRFGSASSPSASFNTTNTGNQFQKNESIIHVKMKPGFTVTPHDRVIAFDEGASVIAFSFVHWDDPHPYEIQEEEYYNNNNNNSNKTDFDYSSSNVSQHHHQQQFRNGFARLRIPISGRFNIRLFSARVGHVLPCKPKELLTVPASMTYPLPFASMQALKRVPSRAADIGISFVKLLDVEDLRPIEIQNRDAVVLVPYGSQDLQFSVPTHLDDPDCQKFLRCEVLYNEHNKFIVFDVRNLKPARYVIRFMVGTENPFLRICTSECTFDICEKGSEFVSEHLATSGGELEGGPRDCDMHTSQQFVERLSTSELAPVRHLRRNAAEIATVARTKHQQQNNNSSSMQQHQNSSMITTNNNTTTTTSNVNTDDENTNVITVTHSNNGEKSLSSFVERRKKLLHGLATMPPFILPPPHEIEGHLLAPVTASAGEIFKINVNIASGAPRLNDLIVLCSEDLTKIFTQVSVFNCMNYSCDDTTLYKKNVINKRSSETSTTTTIDLSSDGVALLYAPETPGKCVAVYFSQAAKGGLFKSNVIKIKKNAAQKQKQQEEQQRLIQQHLMMENLTQNSNALNPLGMLSSSGHHHEGNDASTAAAAYSSFASISNGNNNFLQQFDPASISMTDLTSDQQAVHLRRVFDALTRRRISLDGFSQYASEVDAPLFGMIKQPSRLLLRRKDDMINNSRHHNSNVNNNNNAAPTRTQPRLRILLVGVSYLKQRYDLDGPSNDVSAVFSFFKEHFATTTNNPTSLLLSGKLTSSHTMYSSAKNTMTSSSHSSSQTHNNKNNNPFSSGGLLNSPHNNNQQHQHQSYEPTFDPDVDARVLHELCDDPQLHPTASNIRQGFKWLVDDAQEHDHLVFYFSGSGALVPQIWNYYQKKKNKSDDKDDNKTFDDGNTNKDGNSSLPPHHNNLPTDVQQILLPCDFDFGRKSISYSEIIQDLYGKVAHLQDITVTSIIDAGFTTDATSIIEQRRGVNLQDAAMELGQTLMNEERKKVFNVRTKCRCVPPPQPYPLVTIAADQESVEAPMVCLMTNSNSSSSSSSKTMTNKQQFKLDGLSNVFTSSCSPQAVSFNTTTSASFNNNNFNNQNNNANDEREQEQNQINAVPKNSFFFEASRGGTSATDGCYAYDTFSRWSGSSMGLFTNVLVQVLTKTVKERKSKSLSEIHWFDLLERVQRQIRKNKGGQWQLPILWTSKRGFEENEKSPFLMPVFPLAVSEAEFY